MDSIGVVVATFGDESVWTPLAMKAVKSAVNQSVKVDSIVFKHGDTLAEARNEGVKQLGAEWAIILDADDLLEKDYIKCMVEAQEKGGTLFYPLVGKVYPDGKRELIRYTPCDFYDRNYICIGAMFRREDFLKVGGFDDSLPIFDDWDLWWRMSKNGADIRPSESIYVYQVRENSRNHQGDLIGEWLEKIRAKNK